MNELLREFLVTGDLALSLGQELRLGGLGLFAGEGLTVGFATAAVIMP